MIYDISPLISKKIAVWPGDKTFEHFNSLDTNKGDHLTLSSINTTVHLGAHTDAPNHYATNENGISEVDLNHYLGRCQVIHVNVKLNERIKISHINNKISEQRVLFRTLTFPNPNKWNNDFAALDGELVDYLADFDVKLVGIDTPSIDLFDDKILEAHKRIHFHKMSILEGIVLNSISEGVYELIALPLKLKDADASPVRAILRDIE